MFGVDIEENLVNLSSSVQVEEPVANDLLSLEEREKQQYYHFVKERITEKKTPFHHPVNKKNKMIQRYLTLSISWV